MLTKTKILRILKKLETITSKDEIILVGGVVGLLRYGNYRMTDDIDNISGIDVEIEGIRITSAAERVIELPTGYRERLELLDVNTKKLKIYLLSEIDMVLLKLHRSDKKDWEDIDQILDHISLNKKEELLKLGDTYVINTVGLNFKHNWNYFRKEYLYANK